MSVRLGDGRDFDFTRKAGEHFAHAMMLPDGAPTWATDPAQLWQRAEDSERRGDAQTARLVEIAIPRDVPADQRLDMVRAIVQPWITDGMTAQVDIHCTPATDGAEQPHAHIMVSMRRFDGDAFASKKAREWNAAFTANQSRDMRGQIADAMNAFMLRHEVRAHVDHRTHAAQGLDGPQSERNIPRAAWKAHAADPSGPAAEPVRDTLAARPQRAAARRDIAWETARAAYAAAVAEHYAAEKQRRTAIYAAHRATEQKARDNMRSQHRAAAARTYQQMPRGLVRDFARAAQQRAQAHQTTTLDSAIQAARMTNAAASDVFPAFDSWLDDRAANGDNIARDAVQQRQSRRAWLAEKDPATAARRAVDDVARAADRLLKTRPRGSVDADALFMSARNKLAARRDAAAGTARETRAAVQAHQQATGWWTRQTDPAWRLDHHRLTGAARTARETAARIGGRYDSDVRTARDAARLAAGEHRRTLAAWLDRPNVQAAQQARDTAERVLAALDIGDTDTITAAAAGDLPTAAQAAQAAKARKAAKDQRQRDKADEARQAARRAADERAQDEQERAKIQRPTASRTQQQIPTHSRGLRRL